MRKITAAVTGVLVLAGWAVSAQETPKTTKSDAATIAKATSAAPPEIGRNAGVMVAGPDGKMRELRASKNGWVCMLDPGGDPMCLDQEWQAWGDAWMNKKDPPKPKTVGIAYMLKGDKGASNTDPHATKPTADNQWVVSGPHIMVLPTDAAQLEGCSTDPKAGGPWVMWKGTKYAHLMVPTAPMPKTPPPAKGATKSSTDKK